MNVDDVLIQGKKKLLTSKVEDIKVAYINNLPVKDSNNNEYILDNYARGYIFDTITLANYKNTKEVSISLYDKNNILQVLKDTEVISLAETITKRLESAVRWGRIVKDDIKASNTIIELDKIELNINKFVDNMDIPLL